MLKQYVHMISILFDLMLFLDCCFHSIF